MKTSYSSTAKVSPKRDDQPPPCKRRKVDRSSPVQTRYQASKCTVSTRNNLVSSKICIFGSDCPNPLLRQTSSNALLLI